jgi:hypothetical protein
MANKPSHRVYTVIKRDANPDGTPNDFWLNLGVAYAHDDGNGFNLLLQALPVDAKLVLRTYKEKPDEEAVEIQKGKKYKR